MESKTVGLNVDDHIRKTFQTMDNLRKKKELCDIVLRVGAREISAHRVVLASFSPYFYAMFTSDLAESKQACVTLRDTDPSSLELLIDFAYTARIQVTDANVQNLLPVAALLQISDVQKVCCDFLETQLDPSNCLGIRFFAELYDCEGRLANAARKYCFRNYTKMSQSEEFLHLSKEQLVYYISTNELFVKSEDEVLSSLLRWLKYDLRSRLDSLADLLSHIRLAFVSLEYFDSVIYSKGQQINEEESLVLATALNKNIYNQTCQKLAHRRRPPGPTVIYSAGGYLRRSLSILECYDPSSDKWTALAPLPVPRSGVGAVYLGGMLFVIGGRNNSSSRNMDSASVDRYDPATNEWQAVASLSVARNRLGVGLLKGRIYAVGGGDGNECHNSVECYNPKEERWRLIPPMNTPRIGAGVAVLDGKIYAAGGYDGGRRLRSVECYNPDSKTWMFVSPLQIHRSGAGVASLGRYIYAVGGYNGLVQLSSTERYDPSTDSWTMVGTMRNQRSALSLAVVEDKLFAIGGYNGEGFLTSVEVYDPVQDKWEDRENLSMGRSGAGVSVGWMPSL